jgi:hypothetical protein
MPVPRLANVLLALALSASLPLALRAQVREVVSKEVSVGRSESSLALEFAGGASLEISFEDGVVLVDDESVGTYATGDALDAAWRALLGQAVALDDGPLGAALAEWSVPADLTPDRAATARAIDEALETALRGVEVQSDSGDASVSLGDPRSLVRLLIGDRQRLRLLDDALEGLDDDVRVHIAENVVVGPDEVVEGSLVVIEGDARIEGEVEGDVVVVGGELELLEGSSVSGSLRLADARLVRNLGDVDGEVIQVEDDVNVDVDVDVRDEIREEIRAEVRNEIRNEIRDEGRGFLSPFRSLAEGVGGVLAQLVSVLVLGLVGAAVIAFGGDKVDVIAETARRAPGRAAAVGAAGAILLIPAWVLGFVALVVSIVGIPVAIAWLPAFPIAACVAALVGYLAVARNAGEWLADSDLPWTQWIRKSNSLITMVGGLLGLSLFFMVAHVVSIAPFLGFLNGLLIFAGVVLTVITVQIGFGAVILTRGGRRREYAKYSPDEAWEAAMNVDMGGVDDGPTAESPKTDKENGNA